MADRAALMPADAWQLTVLIGLIVVAARWVGRNRPHLA
jgi:hypothetical protein